MKKLFLYMFLSLLWCTPSLAKLPWKIIPTPQNWIDENGVNLTNPGYVNQESEKSSGEIFLKCAGEYSTIFIAINYDDEKIGWSRDGPPSNLEYDIYLITDNFVKGIASPNATKYKIEARQYTDGFIMIDVPKIEVNRITGNYKISFGRERKYQKQEIGNYMLDGFWVVVTPKVPCEVIKAEKKF